MKILRSAILCAFAVACSKPPPAASVTEAAAPLPSASASTRQEALPGTSAAETAMNTTDPHDLDWLDRLVKSLGTGTFTREQTISFLGDDAGPDSVHQKGRLVRPRSKLLASATVYPLEHIHTPVAMDLVFAPDAQPTLDELGARLGPFRGPVRAPDDFTSGDKYSRYIERADTKTTVRVFAEIDRATRRVAKLFLDAYTSK